MTTFNYNRNIPNAPNNPSSDQPLMQINTNSIEDLLDVDHFSFGETNGGTHKQVQLINQILLSSIMIHLFILSEHGMKLLLLHGKESQFY